MRTKTMGDKSKIDWCDATWNFTVGCSKVSAGCKHCYAERLAARLVRMQAESVYEGTVDKAGRWTGQININEKALDLPLRWKAPRSIFVNSMSDLLHERLSFGQVMRALNVMAQASQHSYIVLTKRPERLLEFARKWVDLAGETEIFRNARGPAATRKHHPSGRGQLFADMLEAMGPVPEGCAYPTFDWMEGMRWWPNAFDHIYWGFSAEDQPTFDRRWAIMRQVASLGWKVVVSLEPLLGSVSVEEAVSEIVPIRDAENPQWIDKLATVLLQQAVDDGHGDSVRLLSSVIVGGESGPGARPMHPDWARSIRDECAAAGVPFFFKQWGEYTEFDDAPCRPGEISQVAVRTPEARAIKQQARDLAANLAFVAPDGRFWTNDRALPHELPCRLMIRVGKKAAGRELDRHFHDALAWVPATLEMTEKETP